MPNRQVLAAALFAAALTRPSMAQTPSHDTSVTAQKALVDRYCVSCHNDRAKTAGLTLQNADLANVPTKAEMWEKVIRKMRAGVMPPPGMRRPSLPEYEGLRDFLENEIDRKAAGASNPGSVVLHRLNRAEYANAVRDLLDLEVDVATMLPSDDSAHGFDNIAGSLTLSPTLLESYMTAATRIARMAVGYWKTPTEAAYIAASDGSQNMHIEGLPLGTRGGLVAKHTFPADGKYKFSIQNFGLGKFIPGEQLEIVIDGVQAHVFKYEGVGVNVGMDATADGTLEVTLPVKAGTRMVGATFLATNYRPSLDMIRHYERKTLENNTIPQFQNYPAIGFLRIQGPFEAKRPETSKSLTKVMTCRPTKPADELPCAKQILTTIARRAYRRPTTANDLEFVMGFYQQGRANGGFEDGIELALRRILASPQFIVRVEKEPDGLTKGKSYRISDLELASRLSFMLWSSIPDDELIDVASKNRLHLPAVLDAQVRRMLADPKSKGLIDNFGSQFLYLRNLPATSPDGVFYPNWDDELRTSFKRETEMLFESIIREDRNVLDLLTADYTFLNERLAKHYGIPNIYGSHMRRVKLGPEMAYRHGLLGQGSFLSLTWVQNFRTSPVKRGVWVLENILGTPPPEPPPNVPPLEDSADSKKIMTLREQMTLHRKNEPCASCHKLMDPIGFALENFDADGSWRVNQGGEGGVPIDASAEIFDGTKVNGPIELRQALLKYSPQYVRMFTEKLMTYGIGRGVEYYDMPVVRAIANDVSKSNNKFTAILMGVIKSAPFQTRVKADEAAD